MSLVRPLSIDHHCTDVQLGRKKTGQMTIGGADVAENAMKKAVVTNFIGLNYGPSRTNRAASADGCLCLTCGYIST